MSQTPATPVITGKMFMFERPELLTKEQHGNLGVKRMDQPYSYSAKVRAIPITVTEIPTAMKHYPIVFASVEEPTPLAVVGIVDDTNLFVNDNGHWEENTYIPGYIRRYPFAFASETGGERLALVIDAGYDGIGPDADEMFFKDGEPTETMNMAVEFCKEYEQARRLTEEVMRNVVKLDIITGQNAQYTPQGQTEQRTFAQYFGVDEQRLKDLSDAEFLELRVLGLLPILYGQVMSLGNWRSLMQRRAVRFNLTDENILQPLKLS